MELEKQIRLAGRVDSVIQKGMQKGKITGACVGIYQNQEEYLCKGPCLDIGSVYYEYLS